MNRGDAEPEQRAPNILDTTPENQAPTFPNLSQVWPVRVIRRGDVVRPFPPHARSLADLTFEVGGVRLGLSDYMVRRRTAGLLDPEARRDRAGALRHGQRPGEPVAQLLDREVDHRDAGGVNNGAFAANGAFGQVIFVDPTEQVVVAIQSAWRQHHDSDAEVENVAMIRAAVRALRTESSS